ncbi:MAG: hypothetical protein KAS57_07915 [Gammaproteobacteria bacterium]|nr:hypothetical protein [Gammaproteobacteria bacterium]
MCKACWALVAVLIAISSVLTYRFVIHGKVAESSDGRIAIVLEDSERNLVLSEMRGFLESVQQITSGISNDDMSLVIEAAKRSGNNARMAVPDSLVGKLPLAFKKLGFDTHSKFDELALNAEQLGDPDHALAQINTLLENCVSCHSMYKINAEITQ